MRKVTKFLLLTTIATLPLYIIRLNIFNLPTTYLEIIIIVTFLIFLVGKIGEGGLGLKSIFPKTSFDIIIYLLLLFSGLSIFQSNDLRGGLGIFKAYFLEPAVLYYMIVATFKKEELAKNLLFALIFSCLWLSGVAIFQLWTAVPLSSLHELLQGRVASVYNSANALALYLGPVFSLLLATYFFGKNYIEKYAHFLFVGATIFLLGFMIIATNSKGSLVAIFAVFVFLLFAFLKNTSSVKKLLYLVPFSVLFSVLFPILATFSFFDLTPPVVTGEYKGQDTAQIRLYLWEGTGGLLLDRPFFGAGLDGFKELYATNYSLPQYREFLQYPHNFFLTVFSELGVLGFLTFTFLLGRLSSRLVQAGSWGIILGAAIVYFMVHGLVDVPFFKNDLSAQFFLFLAMAEIATRK